MIHIHRETGDIIYIYLLKATLQVLKLQSSKRKVGDLLKKEKVEKKLQVELLVIDSQADKGASAQKLLTEKKNCNSIVEKEDENSIY